MNRLVALLFILVYSADSLKVNSSGPLAPYAIKGIIDHHASKKNRGIEIFSFGKTNGDGERMLERLFQLENSSVTIRNIKDKRRNRNVERIIIGITSVLIFDSLENFFRTLQGVFLSRRIYNLSHYVFYIPEIGIEDIEPFFREIEMAPRIYALVNETPQSIDLATSFYYKPGSCFKNHWEIVNRFVKDGKRWEGSTFFEEKERNWHKCPMKLQYYEGKYETELFSIFAKYLNFTPEKTYRKTVDLSSFYFSLSRGITSVLAKENFHQMKFMHFEQSKIFIPPGELYGDYEKMLLPFDTLTWIGIVLTIVGGAMVILFIKCLSPSNQELYFGRNNRSPMMNFISIILNGNQSDNLVESLPRMLLMLFIVWCLIFR
jgi:hypothetical protein